MAQSETEICNDALIECGATRILSLDEDSEQARLCKQLYPRHRDSLLRAHPWNFAIRRLKLPALSAEPEFEYGSYFQLPKDCLRVLELYPDDIDWRKEGDRIISETNDELFVKCIWRVTEVGSYDACFDRVLALSLAHGLSYTLTQSEGLKNTLYKSFREALAEARSFDGQESQSRQVVANDWINSRF